MAQRSCRILIIMAVDNVDDVQRGDGRPRPRRSAKLRYLVITGLPCLFGSRYRSLMSPDVSRCLQLPVGSMSSSVQVLSGSPAVLCLFSPELEVFGLVTVDKVG